MRRHKTRVCICRDKASEWCSVLLRGIDAHGLNHWIDRYSNHPRTTHMQSCSMRVVYDNSGGLRVSVGKCSYVCVCVCVMRGGCLLRTRERGVGTTWHRKHHGKERSQFPMGDLGVALGNPWTAAGQSPEGLPEPWQGSPHTYTCAHTCSCTHAVPTLATCHTRPALACLEISYSTHL